MDDLAKSQITCDRRRVENRRLLTKLEENSKSTPLYEQQTTLETQEQPLMVTAFNKMDTRLLD